MMKKKYFYLLIALIVTTNLFAQKKGWFELTNYTNPTMGFNFFVGNDAKNFITTPKVLGSGIYDFSRNYNLFPIWILNPHKNKLIGISFPVGIRIAKYRFADNIYFQHTNGNLEYGIDNVSGHYYNNFPLSYDGSKLVTGNWHLPILVYLPIQHWFGSPNDNFGIFGSFFYDRYAFAYHKRRYKVDENRYNDKISNSSFKNYGIRKNKFGVSGGIKLKWLVLYAQYVISPFFDDNVNIDIYEMRVGIRLVNPKKGKDEEKEEKNHGIEIRI